MKYGIIGAGPSGLCASLMLKHPCDILEADSRPGGHAASYVKDGFTLDYGPHIMFSKDKEVLQFMIDVLQGNVHQCKRNNKISFKGKLVKYPFENDLKSLPLEDNFACLKGFVYNEYATLYEHPNNLKEWLLKVFGKGICEAYLFPYNEKVWNVAVEELSMEWADRIPRPPVDDIIKSAIGFETEGYLHQLYYHYPRTGGYEAISQALAKGTKIQYNFPIKRIRANPDGTFSVSDGKRELSYDRLISTMPIHQLIDIFDGEIPDSIRQLVGELIVNPMAIISVGVKGIDENQFTAVYFPEKEFYVNRVSYPGTFSPENCPKGHYCIQAEITYKRDSDIARLSDEEIEAHVIDGLKTRGLLPEGHEVVFTDVARKEFSYVVYDQGYREKAEIVRNYFSSLGIELLGRFSYFEYVNVDGAIIRALDVVSKLNNDGRSKQAMLKDALAKVIS